MEEVIAIWKELSFKTLLEKTEYVAGRTKRRLKYNLQILDEIDASILQDTDGTPFGNV